MTPRVIITGIGLVTPLGITTASTWRTLLSGATAVKHIVHHPSIPVKIGAMVDRELLPSPPPLLSPCPDFAAFALIGAHEALRDAGLLRADPSEDKLRGDGYDLTRAGVSIGVGMGYIEDAVAASESIHSGRYRRVSPFLVPRLLPNTPAGLVALRHALRGPVLAPSTACAAGAHAIGDGFHAIQRGDVDMMVVGGAEAAVGPVAVAGFARAKALTSSWNDDPSKASRPFDKRRNGFVIGDGAGILVLENADSARRRGITEAYAEVLGFGMSGDAYHITSPAPDGNGAIRAMRDAVRMARREVKDLDYVNAHATSTPLGDAVERRAIATVLDAETVGNRAVVSSTKGATGHLLGAAGGVEAAFAALAVCTGKVPPTVNLEEVDDDPEAQRLGWGDADRFVPQVARSMDVDFALCNSFGFGGTNACVAIAKTLDFNVKEVR